jgi:hypothetical protein
MRQLIHERDDAIRFEKRLVALVVHFTISAGVKLDAPAGL